MSYQANVNMNAPGVEMTSGAGYNNNMNMNAGYNNNMNQGYNNNMNMQMQTPQMNMGMGGGSVMVVNNMMPMVPYVCGRPVPHIGHCGAIAVLILNIFWPGFGTAICGCIPHYGSMNCIGDCCCFYWLGVAHFLLWGILVGWILGIVLGCQLITVAAMDTNMYVSMVPQMGVIGGGVVVVR